MLITITGVGLFLLAFVIHVVWWRVKRPRRSGQVLIAQMVAVICAGWLIAIAVSAASATPYRFLPDGPIAFAHALVVALALAAAYVMTYPAIEVESPILIIIDAIARRGNEGIGIAALRNTLDDKVLVAPLVQNLVNENLASLDGGQYRATSKGVALVRAFVKWRDIIGAGKGG